MAFPRLLAIVDKRNHDGRDSADESAQDCIVHGSGHPCKNCPRSRRVKYTLKTSAICVMSFYVSPGVPVAGQPDGAPFMVVPARSKGDAGPPANNTNLGLKPKS